MNDIVIMGNEKEKDLDNVKPLRMDGAKKYKCKCGGIGTSIFWSGKMIYNCPLCSNKRIEKEKKNEEENRRNRYLNRFKHSIGLDISSFSVSQSTKPNLITKFEIGSSMVIFGEQGTGKTACSILIGERLITEYGVGVKYCMSADLLRSLKNKSKHFYDEVMKSCKRPYLLIIDEVGLADHGTDHDIQTMQGFYKVLLEFRRLAKKSTILISNHLPSSETFTDLISTSLTRKYQQINIEGVDRRFEDIKKVPNNENVGR